ncbi:MAG: hypothetical protein US70_C0002G0048 [Parcubacteria group bacterium GW2011_GWD2_38_11]|nr:MAG: hypothetical protein US70_C0002G0048 [Parcubacteria group bacterium GW2011_GWD2_38_11]
MNYKKKNYWILIGSTTVSILSLVLGSPDIFGLCVKNDINCLHKYIDISNTVILPFFVFAVPIFIISFIIVFLREQIFNAWSKFAIIFIPISIVSIFFLPSMGDMFFPSIKELAIFLLPVIFLISSLGIIFWESRKAKK